MGRDRGETPRPSRPATLSMHRGTMGYVVISADAAEIVRRYPWVMQ